MLEKQILAKAIGIQKENGGGDGGNYAFFQEIIKQQQFLIAHGILTKLKLNFL